MRPAPASAPLKRAALCVHVMHGPHERCVRRLVCMQGAPGARHWSLFSTSTSGCQCMDATTGRKAPGVAAHVAFRARAPLLPRGLARRGRRASGRGGRDDVSVVAAHEGGAHRRRLLLQHRVQRPRLADACAPGMPRPLRPVPPLYPNCTTKARQ